MVMNSWRSELSIFKGIKPAPVKAYRRKGQRAYIDKLPNNTGYTAWIVDIKEDKATTIANAKTVTEAQNALGIYPGRRK